MKCTTIKQAIDRYGAIDFASKHWPMEYYWIKTFNVDSTKFPHWRVLDSNLPVQHISVNLDLVEPLTAALQAISDNNLGHLLHTFDGCFNIRMVRGTVSSPSAHSYGLALDINASENPLGAISGGLYNEPLFVKCFTDQGFDWGGHFHHRKDPQHFSYAWE